MKEDIKYYSDYKRENGTPSLSENIWNDLDLDDFFTFSNRSSSRIGEQYLYYLLCSDNVSQVWKYEELINRLSADQQLSYKLMKILSKLNHPDAYSIVSLFSRELPLGSSKENTLIKYFRFLPFLFTGLFLILKSGYLLIPLIGTVIINLILHYQNKSRIRGYFFSIPQLIKMLGQAELLIRIPETTGIDKDVSGTVNDLRHLKKSLISFNWSFKLEREVTQLAFMITELFNIFFLTEAYAVNKALKLLNGKQKQLEQVYSFVGLLDVLISISLLRESLPYYCLPTLPNSTERINTTDIYHPLIENAVSNNFNIQAKSVIITGSNMSGKTSFIRTIGINLISGRVFNTCFARSFVADVHMCIASAIHITDSLTEGKSYFLQEVEYLKTMIELSKDSNYLFLIDEPFKGTNTLERLAIGKAVLSALEQGNIVLASTHDRELSKLLDHQYLSYHFSESINNGLLNFDYKIKPGISTETNAIKILEIYQYPENVLSDAWEQIKKFNHKSPDTL